MSASGKVSSLDFNSWRQTMSGFCSARYSSSRGSRALMPLTLEVTSFTRLSSMLSAEHDSSAPAKAGAQRDRQSDVEGKGSGGPCGSRWARNKKKKKKQKQN